MSEREGFKRTCTDRPASVGRTVMSNKYAIDPVPLRKELHFGLTANTPSEPTPIDVDELQFECSQKLVQHYRHHSHHEFGGQIELSRLVEGNDQAVEEADVHALRQCGTSMTLGALQSAARSRS